MHLVMEAKVSLSLFIFILLPILSIVGKVTSSSSSLDISPFGLFKSLQGSKKGDKVEGIHKVKQYLERYGYLNTTSRHVDNDFDDALEFAMKSFQSYYHLNPTGILDAPTVKEMSKSRCGVPDIVGGSNSGGGFGSSHFAFLPGMPRWPVGMRKLKYFYDTNLNPRSAFEPISDAFASWALVSPFTFEWTLNPATAHIRVSFETGDHGDGMPFGGPNSDNIAHAFAPIDGRLHLNTLVNWDIGAHPNTYDLETAVTHEIGHLLGLAHSSVPESMMYPFVDLGTVKTLTQDDIDGINALYYD